MPKCPNCGKYISKTRTTAQNSALWLFFTQLADVLNEAGLEQRKVLRQSYNMWWNKNSVHDHIWIPIQKHLYKTKSTTDLSKHEEIEKIHELIMRELGEKHGVEYVPFPHIPDRAVDDKGRINIHNYSG